MHLYIYIQLHNELTVNLAGYFYLLMSLEAHVLLWNWTDRISPELHELVVMKFKPVQNSLELIVNLKCSLCRRLFKRTTSSPKFFW